MNAGDAFLIENEHGIKHLHVIVSDPVQNPDCVYLVMVSTHEERREDGCILMKGDHPRIHHQSMVVYQKPPAVITSVSMLSKLVAKQILTPQPPVSDEVLARIRDGCKVSKHIESRIENMLYQQGLLQY